MQKILSHFILKYQNTAFSCSSKPGMKGKPVNSTDNGKRINVIATSTNDILKVPIKNITAPVKGMKATIMQLCETSNDHFKPEEMQEGSLRR